MDIASELHSNDDRPGDPDGADPETLELDGDDESMGLA